MTELLPLHMYKVLLSEEGRPELFRRIRDISVKHGGCLQISLAQPLIEAHLKAIGLSSMKLIRGVLQILPIWGISKTVYRFDPDLLEELGNTDIDRYIPIEIFDRLPDYCPFIECRIPLTEVFSHRVSEGFFVSRISCEELHGLRVCIVCRSESDQDAFVVQTLTLPLSDKLTIGQSLASFLDKDSNSSPKPAVVYECFKKILSLILYLCSIGSEIQDRPSSEKKPMQIHGALPEKPRIADVGLRIGSAIRSYRIEQAKQDSEAVRTGRTLSPHIRRAHWHHFWTGPMHESRTLILKWIPPIPVNLDKGELPVTIRPVRI